MRTFPILLLVALAVVALALAVGGLLEGRRVSVEAPAEVAGRREVGTPQPMRPRVEVVATHLEIPWALAFAPDGRLFFTERPGRIRAIVEGQLLPDPIATLQVAAENGGEAGLLGLDLDPRFQQNGYLYVMYSYRERQGRLQNRISRMTVRGNQAGEEKVLLEGIPGGTIHDGGRLKLGPDGRLYATAGDTSDPSTSQDPNSLAGKTLRIDVDGSIPEDNPFPGSPVFTLGHRNPQGLAFQPGTGRLFSTEHGPGGNDEVNLLEAGQNYGWPIIQGIAKNPKYADSLIAYSPTIAPSGATFYQGDQLFEWTGNLFFATLRGEHLHRMVLGGGDSRQVVFEERLFDRTYGRLRDVLQGPDGYLYFATNNRDNRGGNNAPDNDRILRVVPR